MSGGGDPGLQHLPWGSLRRTLLDKAQRVACQTCIHLLRDLPKVWWDWSRQARSG